MIESAFLTLVAGETLAAKRRVKLSGTTAIYAGATEIGIGVTEFAVLSGEDVTIRLDNGGGTMEIAAAGEIAAGAPFYPAASGRITATVGGLPLGFALAAASALDDIINVLRTRVAGELTLGDQIFSDVLEGGSPQGPYGLSLLKNYPFGTRRVTRDGRVFKYGCAISTLNTDLLAQSNSHVQAVAYAAVQATAAAGATSLKVTVGATDGDGSGNIAADALAEGSIVIFPHSENSINMKITGNTVLAGGTGGTMTVTLEHPLPIPITHTSMHVEIMANQFAAVKAGSAGDLHKSFIGLPMMPATTLLPHHWEQTWGECWVAPDNGWSSADVGNTRENHQVVARYNGSIAIHDSDDAENELQQHVGFVLSRARANTQGAPFIMLQISR